MRAVPWLAVVLAAGLIGLAGCGGDDDESDVAAFCDKVEELESQPDPFEDIGEGDVEGVRDAFENAEEQFAEVADVAPEEISGDIEEVQSVLSDISSSLEDAESPQDLTAIVDEFQTAGEELEETGQRLEEYTNENCDTGGDTTG
jgi:hypothetical protein